MSSLGKTFIVLNLALAALFVGAAATLVGAGGGWRTKYDTLSTDTSAQVRAKDESISKLQAELGQTSDELNRVKTEKSQIDATLKDAQSQLATATQKNADLTESLNGINAKLGDLEQTNRSQSGRVTDMARQLETLRTERDAAMDERDAAVALSTQSSETSTMAESKIADLTSSVARLTDEKESAEAKLLEVCRAYGADPSDFRGQPDQEGLVLDASYTSGAPIVVINIGRQEKVRPGYTFDVFGGGTYKGRLRVDVVNETNAAGTLVMAGNGQVAAGDRVKTRL